MTEFSPSADIEGSNVRKAIGEPILDGLSRTYGGANSSREKRYILDALISMWKVTTFHGVVPPAYTYKDLEGEGYKAEILEEIERPLKSKNITVKLYKDGKVMDSTIQLLVVDEFKTIVVKQFYPRFPQERKAR